MEDLVWRCVLSAATRLLRSDHAEAARIIRIDELLLHAYIDEGCHRLS